MRVTDRFAGECRIAVLTLFHVENEIYHSFQPRLSARYLLRRIYRRRYPTVR